MKYVIIMNGKPECGKDTFVSYAVRCINDRKIGYGIHLSSINPIKDICRQLGWNGEKTDYWRSVMSDLKAVWVESCDGPTRYILENILAYKSEHGDSFIFVDIRETYEISKIYRILKELRCINIIVKSVIIKRPEVDNKKHRNSSDNNVDKINYDYTIHNDSNLECLKNKAYNFIEEIVKEN